MSWRLLKKENAQMKSDDAGRKHTKNPIEYSTSIVCHGLVAIKGSCLSTLKSRPRKGYNLLSSVLTTNVTIVILSTVTVRIQEQRVLLLITKAEVTCKDLFYCLL
jgi:hypothetical protein